LGIKGNLINNQAPFFRKKKRKNKRNKKEMEPNGKGFKTKPLMALGFQQEFRNRNWVGRTHRKGKGSFALPKALITLV